MDNSNSKSNYSKKKNNKEDKKEKNLGREVTQAWKEFTKAREREAWREFTKAKKEINDSEVTEADCAVTVIVVLLGILAYKALSHFV